jgi:hypothetical protein
MDDRLPTDLWVAAHLRQCTAKALPAYVIHKGAPASGTVMVKIVIRGPGKESRCKLLNQARDSDGNMGWMDLNNGNIVDETHADQYIQRAISRDPDVWVIEVEDASGKNPFEGKIF